MHGSIIVLLPYIVVVWLRTTLPCLGHADIQQRVYIFSNHTVDSPNCLPIFFHTCATFQIFGGLAEGLVGAAPEVLGVCAI